jgi:predicted SPOUT superfamily RNA methylase MTH1
MLPVITSFGGGVQYTEGDVDATITGTAMMMEDAGNTLRPAQGSIADGLLVNLGANNDVTITGTVTVDTELPSASALADNDANPTTSRIGANLLIWDGATWDRAPGNAANGLLVDLGANNDVTVTGTVTADTELPSASALADNDPNPTTPRIGANLLIWDGANWDRAPGNTANGLLVDLGANNDVTVTGTVSISGTVTVDTELPTASALADDDANPTTSRIGANLLIWDGATWDRAPGTSANGLLVNLGTNNDVTVTGTVSISGTVTVDTELPSASALADNDPNPTTSRIGANLLIWDGATWDRAPGDSAQGLDVDITRPPANVVASGALGALNAAVSIRAEGTGTLNWEIDTGTLVGTVVFEATLDDTNWFAIEAMRINGTVISSTVTFADRGVFTSTGYSQVRLRVSAFTSGTSNARIEASAGASAVRIAGTIPISGTITADTELPAASALADNDANPTTSRVGANLLIWDGATWDRAPGTSADGLLVNLGANNDVTVTGTVSITGTVTVDTELPSASALADNDANPTTSRIGANLLIWDGATWDRAPGTSADGLLVNLGANNDVTVTGTVTVDTELPAAVALADNDPNPTTSRVGANLLIWDGANWDRAPGNTADGQLVNLGANNDVTVTGTVSISGTVTVDTELPAATALADNDANPTTSRIGANLLVWDGSTWDRAPGTSANGLLVDLGANNDVTITGTVTVDTELPAAAALADNDANPTTSRVGANLLIWDGATWDRAPGNSADGQLVNLGANNDVTVTGTVSISGTVTVDTELPAASALADNDPNPTTSRVGANLLIWDGTNWDRAPGNSTVGLVVDLGNNNDVTVSGTVDVGSVLASIVPGTSSNHLGKAEDAGHVHGDTGVMALAVSNEANVARAADGDYIPIATDTEGNVRLVGNRDHDAVDAGEVVKVGGVAVSGSATPTSVAAADRTRFIANQHGIPYVIAGHPNLITREYDFGASAQTDVNLAAAAVAADERIYVTRFEALNDAATTAAAVPVRAGFGTASVPTASASGVSGMIGSHPGLAPGSGVMCGTGAGIIAVGAAGEEPRFTCSAATAGNIHVIFSYYLIDETP